MNKLFAIAIVLVFAAAVDGQSTPVGEVSPRPAPAKCELGIENAPSFRGLRLRMDDGKAAAVVGVDFKLESSPYPRFSLAYASMLNTQNPLVTRSPQFSDVMWVRMESIDAKVTSVMINYKPEWNSAKEFADHFIPQIAVPVDSWTFAENNGTVESACAGFNIRLDLNGGRGRLTLTDPVAIKRKLDQIEAEKEAQRRALKP